MFDFAAYKRRRRKEALLEGLCGCCWTRSKIEGRTYCTKCSERRKLYRSSQNGKRSKKAWELANKEKVLLYKRRAGKRATKKVKDIILSVYGSECACCGEHIKEFLTIDHIDRKSFPRDAPRTGKDLYRWLIKHNFPNGVRILCFNCNCAREFSGSCPHDGKVIGRLARSEKGKGLLQELYPKYYASNLIRLKQ